MLQLVWAFVIDSHRPQSEEREQLRKVGLKENMQIHITTTPEGEIDFVTIETGGQAESRAVLNKLIPPLAIRVEEKEPKCSLREVVALFHTLADDTYTDRDMSEKYRRLAEMLTAMADGNKLHAIKGVRSYFGYSLGKAKMLVEQMPTFRHSSQLDEEMRNIDEEMRTYGYLT
jgi:ribosomal protein L7/L12